MIAQQRRRATTTAGVAALTMMLVLASCGDEAPDPEPTAEAVAQALATGDFSEVRLAGVSASEAATELEDVVQGMGAAQRAVELRAVVRDEQSEDTWVATFDVGWELTGGEADASGAEEDGGAEDGGAENGGAAADGTDSHWTYTTTALLTPADDGEEDEQWQVEWSPSLVHPDLESGARLRATREQAERGDIQGAGGDVVVTERDVYRIGIDKTKFDNDANDETMADAARELAAVVGVDEQSFSERVVAAGEKAFVEAITFREQDAQPLLDDIDDLGAAIALSDALPLAPSREFARPILGTVGEATAEIIEESQGRVEVGDVVGLSGLQLQYDEMLRGKPGVRVEVVPAEGDPAVVYESEPVPGEPLVTTLDVDLQAHAESVLAGVEPASAIVAVQPSTGNVVAAASGSGGDGYSTATLGQYAPGSTFKVVTSLALLRGDLTPETPVQCPPTITVDGREFGNYSDYPDSALGEISLRTALAESCNTAFIGLNEQAPQASLAEAASSLGLGGAATESGSEQLGFPAFLGSAPEEADGTSHVAAMIGQGDVLASPLGMATVAASVAAGETVVPQLLEGLEGMESPTTGDDGGAGAAEPLNGDEAAQLQQMMRAVVDGGSASFLQDVPGGPVAAKTGTAEYGTESPPRTHAWMIAIQDDLAVAVFVEDGESGGQTAGPLFEEFLKDR